MKLSLERATQTMTIGYNTSLTGYSTIVRPAIIQELPKKPDSCQVCPKQTDKKPRLFVLQRMPKDYAPCPLSIFFSDKTSPVFFRNFFYVLLTASCNLSSVNSLY